MPTRNDRIRYIRKGLAQSQEQFAGTLGIHRVTLAKVESGIEAGPRVAEIIDRFIANFDEQQQLIRRIG